MNKIIQSTIFASTAAALIFCGTQVTARASGFSLPSLTVSSTGVAVNGAAATVNSATTAAACAAGNVSSAVSNAVTSALPAATSSASSSTITSALSTISSLTSSAPTLATPSANDYVKNFSQVCTDAATAYKNNDLVKAATLMPKVQSMYSQGTTVVNSLKSSGNTSDATKLTDWKSSLMSAVSSAAGSYLK